MPRDRSRRNRQAQPLSRDINACPGTPKMPFADTSKIEKKGIFVKTFHRIFTKESHRNAALPPIEADSV